MINQKFKSIKKHYGYDQYSNILEANLVNYYSWNFLEIGAWAEVSVDEEDYFEDDISRLRLVSDPSYTDGQVWEAMRKDWIWESGVNYIDTSGSGRSPLPVSNLEINGIATTGNYYINYPEGRVVFDGAVDTDSIVKIQYSYRSVQVISANSPLWKQIQKETEVYGGQFLTQGSGDWDIMSSNRIQLPLIAIEVDAMGDSNGYELGNSAIEAHRDVVFHILAEDKSSRNNIMDIVANQCDADIWLYDTAAVALNNAYSLDFEGNKVKNITYPDLVSETGYRWKTARMEDAQIINVGQIHTNLYEAVVKTTFTSVL